MSTNWKRKALSARTSLMSNGALCSLEWTPASTDTGPRAVAPPAVEYEAYGAIFDYTAGVSVQQDSLIAAGNRQLLLSVFTEPALGDLPTPPKGARVVAPDGIAYKVDRVKITNPAGVAVLYELNLAR